MPKLGTTRVLSAATALFLRYAAGSIDTLRVRLCEELNIASREGCHFATAALTRALVDHVPPLFGKKNFSEVANNYAGTRSFREAMEHLDSAAKKMADGHLHIHIYFNNRYGYFRDEFDYSRAA
jgi:hypothetical protein